MVCFEKQSKHRTQCFFVLVQSRFPSELLLVTEQSKLGHAPRQCSEWGPSIQGRDTSFERRCLCSSFSKDSALRPALLNTSLLSSSFW